jgi:hypothetical protein
VVARSDGRAGAGHTRLMGERSEVLRLVLEVERDVDPIRGTVADPHGPARPYVGWVALIGALDELRGASGGDVEEVES